MFIFKQAILTFKSVTAIGVKPYPAVAFLLFIQKSSINNAL